MAVLKKSRLKIIMDAPLEIWKDPNLSIPHTRECGRKERIKKGVLCAVLYKCRLAIWNYEKINLHLNRKNVTLQQIECCSSTEHCCYYRLVFWPFFRHVGDVKMPNSWVFGCEFGSDICVFLRKRHLQMKFKMTHLKLISTYFI